MKYLQYKASTKHGEGLLDRRMCLMILLAEAKLSHRIAVLPKFLLGSQHNNGKKIESYLIDTYFDIDKLQVEYILDEEFAERKKKIDTAHILNIKNKKIDQNSDKTLIVRNLPSDNFWKLKKLGAEVINLAKNYQGVGQKYVIPLVTTPEYIKAIGDQILNQLERPVIGLHLRRGDRLNKRLNDSMNEKTIINKLEGFNYNSVFYCSNDQNYRINNDNYFSISKFKHLVESIGDNYLLFCVEMYIVDNCDISVRTFNDSSPFYFIEDQSNKNYSICNYSMHGSNNQAKNIPDELIKCDYVSYASNDRKGFAKRGITIPRILNGIRKVFKSVFK